MQHLEINRRRLLQSMLAGVGANVSLASCTHQGSVVQTTIDLEFYAVMEFAALATLADMIIPETQTPGAVSAGVPKFMDNLMAQWASPQTQAQHRQSLQSVSSVLSASTDAEREARLVALDTRAFAHNDEEPEYRSVKALIVNAYFTSEAGATLERPWISVPGRWDPAVEIEKRESNV